MESHRQQILLSVWALGILYASALNSTQSVSFAVGEHTYIECAPLNDHSDMQRLALASANLIFTCIIPSILIIYTYRFIQIKVNRSMRNGNVAYAVNFNPTTTDTKNVTKAIQVIMVATLKCFSGLCILKVSQITASKYGILFMIAA